MKLLFAYILLITAACTHAQVKFTAPTKNVFQCGNAFIENKGQYNYFAKEKILYGFEGTGSPVLLTTNGIVFIQQKTEWLTNEDEAVKKVAEEKERIKITKAVISMEWVGANKQAAVVAEDMAPGYHTYGAIKEKVSGYRKVIYKNLYPGIDLVYHFTATEKTGFEYSFIVKPGADLSKIKMRYGGDIKKIYKQEDDILKIISAVDTITENFAIGHQKNFGTGFYFAVNKKLTGNAVSFSVPFNYDKTEELIIDPFVSPASGFAGVNGAKAKDVDFDYAGNVYVSGGGNWNQHQLSKFDATGNLLWTFNGSISSPSWIFGNNYGGWTVDKNTGECYLGNGANQPAGTRVIRLNSSGLYDNYISDAVFNFTECWKLFWNCANGNAEIVLGAGNTINNLNFATLPIPGTTLSPVTLTGLPGFAQDVADIIVDPVTNDMYTIYASAVGTPSVNNKIYKYSYPYSISSIQWSVPSGFTSLQEDNNRPYLANTPISENSVNFLAINSNYLFYWDGNFLKAFSKATGAAVGAIFNASLPVKEQGGIYADECDNVFIGYAGGLIKVLHFNGTSFDDAAQPDIVVTNIGSLNVYDLAFNSGNGLLYASGNGFVASVDISSFCTNNTYTVNVSTDCATLSATASLTPMAPFGSVVTYSLYNGVNFISSNTTGLFGPLAGGISYTIKAVINQNCSGFQAAAADFNFNSCTLYADVLHEICNNANGSITAHASFGTAPYTFSLDGVSFQNSNIFSPLPAGNYTVTAKDALNTLLSINISLNNIAPVITNMVLTPAICSQSNGSITLTVSNGLPPYQYSKDGINYQLSNSFISLAPGNYIFRIKDANNCIVSVNAVIDDRPSPVFGATVTHAGCFNNNGIIDINVTNGSPPYSYSIDGNNYSNTNRFTALSAGNYTVYVKDANGCIAQQAYTIQQINNIVVNAGADTTVCIADSINIASTAANAVSFLWVPAVGLSDATLLSPKASPQTNTMYHIFAYAGLCVNEDSVWVIVNARPVANAGADVVTCFQKNVQLQGSGGVLYNWQPPTYLNNKNISNPLVINPSKTISYSLSVTDANGCVSAKKDTVNITVLPPEKIFAGNDTVIVKGQPLQLNAKDINNTGFTQYQWQPSTGLNNTFISNPVAVLNSDVLYHVTGNTTAGCTATDDIYVKVFKEIEIYVPAAFTPGKDGLNDLLKAIPVGIKAFKHFTVFNRLGQKLFITTDYGIGWDGTYKGASQPMGTYVWIAEATDYLGRTIQRKGYVVLIR